MGYRKKGMINNKKIGPKNYHHINVKGENVNKKIILIKVFVNAIIFTGALTILSTLLFGCSKSTPKCDSGKAVTGVIDTVGQDFKKDLAALTGMGGPGMELTDDEWKTIRAGMIIDLENIREQGFNENSGKRTCAASLLIVSGGKKKIIPITYISEIQKDSGELKTTISGLAEFKQEQTAPPRVPE